jgi:hypothetical protein
LSNPLLGFDPPTRCIPKSLLQVSRLEAPLLGFLAPSTLAEERAHGSPVTWSSSPVLPGLRWLVPPSQLRCHSQVFTTSQWLLSLSTLLPCFRQVALLGFCPSGVCSSHEAPAAPRRWHALLTFLPTGCACSILGRSSIGRTCCFLGYPAGFFCRLQGFQPRENRSTPTEYG